MQKSFKHLEKQYSARTNMNGDLLEIGIFTTENKRPFHLQVTSENFAGLTLDGKTATVEKLVDFVISDFCRLIDEGMLAS